MRYISHILLPGEQILFSARVHPVLLLKGFLMACASLWLLYMYRLSVGETYAVARFAHGLYERLPQGRTAYAFCKVLADFGTSWGTDIKIIGFILLLPGIKAMALAWEQIMFTELVVTNRRVIAKIGVVTTTTIEIDRRRITEVIVHQNLPGRLLNYGTVSLEGFAGGIEGLPVIAKPYMVQQALALGPVPAL